MPLRVFRPPLPQLRANKKKEGNPPDADCPLLLPQTAGGNSQNKCRQQRQ